MLKPYSASYECARRLIAAGCPIDYLNELPRDSGSWRRALYIEQIIGYGESRVIDLDNGHIGYTTVIRIRTDLPRGIVISDWSFRPPWNHDLSWDCEPHQVIPASECPSYAEYFDSRLLGVLNERRLLRRGYPVEGVLTAIAYFQSLPELVKNGARVAATLSLTADTEMTFNKTIYLSVDRSYARKIVEPRMRRPNFQSARRDPETCERFAEVEQHRGSQSCGGKRFLSTDANCSARRPVLATDSSRL